MFDAAGAEIKLDADTVIEIQQSMLDVLRASQPKLTLAQTEALTQAETFLKTAQPSPDETVAVTNAMVATMLTAVSADLRARYDWRRRTIHTYYIRSELIARLRKDLLAIIAGLGIPAIITGDPAYIADCRSRGVPIPPDWSEDSSDWQLQGELTVNLLQPGSYAGVYTYSDPATRGGCIALPRGTGDGAAGIICQAATGHACFWDNIRRSDGTLLGWRDRTLVIAELQDGSNLSQACPSCHNGSNVFNISPDDPTWVRVLRELPQTSTFTTRVESSPDRHLGKPRYVPITTDPPRAGWANARPTFEGCNECHETPHGAFANRPPMPPTCARGLDDPRHCYWPETP